MKPRSNPFLSILAIAASVVLLQVSSTLAASFYWDNSAGGTPETNPSWATNANWATTAAGGTNPSNSAIPGSNDDVFFNITTLTAAQTVNLVASRSAKSLTFSSTSTGGVTIKANATGTTDRTLSLGHGGITMASTAGTVNLGTAPTTNGNVFISLTGSQTWTNNSASDMNWGSSGSASSLSRAAGTGATLTFVNTSTGGFKFATQAVPNTATGIIGNWAFFGSGTNTRYAYNNAGTIAGYTGTSAADAEALTSATTNYELSTTGSTTLTTDRTANTIRSSGAGYTIDLGSSGANTLGLNGILAVGASGDLTIQRTGGTGTVVAGSEMLVSGPQNVVISAPISGGGITKSGSGTLTLSGANTHTGTTIVSGGTLRAGSSSAFGASHAVAVGNVPGATFDLNGNALTIGSLAGSGAFGGTVALGASNLTLKATTNNQTYNGLFTGSGSIIVDATTATNQVNFGGDNTAASGAGYTGNVSVNSGTLQLGKTSNILGTNTATTQTVVIASGAAVNLAYGNAAYTHAQNFVINGTGTAVAGNAALSGTQLGFGNGTIGGLAVASDATIRTTLNTATESRGVNVTRGLVGTGKLTKIGNGYLYLNAAAPASPVTWAGTSYSGFTGDVDVSVGVIQLANVSNVLGANASGTQLVTISSGAAVVLNGGNGAYTANQNFVLNGTGTGQAANLGGLAALELTNVNFGNEQIRGIAVATNSTISVNRNSAAANTFGLDVNGPLAGTGTLTVTSLNASTSNATLYLKAAAGAVGSHSAFTGNVEIRNGARLASNHATALGTTANVDVADGSVLSIGANQTLGGLTNATTAANTGSVLLNSRTLTIGSTNNLNSAFSGVISNGSGAGGIIKDGTGTLTLTGDNSYTGSTGVTQGTLLISGSGDINQTSGVTISTAGTFRYNSSVAYSGGAITNNGGTIAGSGTIGASVALDSLSDKLAPGNSPGIQNYGISQTWNAFTYQWETNNFTGTTAGTDFDQITITGSLTLDLAGSYAVDLLSLTALNVGGNVANFSETTRQWAILTASGGISNFDVGDWTINEGGFTSSPTRTGTFSLSADANTIYLNYALVPEPSGMMLAAVGMLGIAARRRRNA